MVGYESIAFEPRAKPRKCLYRSNILVQIQEKVGECRTIFFLIKTSIDFYHHMLFSKTLSSCILHEILFIHVQHEKSPLYISMKIFIGDLYERSP